MVRHEIIHERLASDQMVFIIFTPLHFFIRYVTKHFFCYELFYLEHLISLIIFKLLV